MVSHISEKIRMRGKLQYGECCIVDDFCYISTNVILGNYVHIGPNCTLAGGKNNYIFIDGMSSVSSGCRLYVTSNDYVNDLVVCVDKNIGDKQKRGDITLKGINGIGANTVVMPNVVMEFGAVVGASSYVPFSSVLEEWGVYAGCPVKKIGTRNKINVMKQAKMLEER
jgi:carbonic anhydrase/acetyltransferase-like protein (isoleucine patch superfamily)